MKKLKKAVERYAQVTGVHFIRTELREVNKLPSMTEPKQVEDLQTILNHRQRGIPVPIFNGVFSEQDTPDIFKMDFGEIALLREETAAGIEAAKEDLHALTKQMEELKSPPKQTPPVEPVTGSQEENTQ